MHYSVSVLALVRHGYSVECCCPQSFDQHNSMAFIQRDIVKAMELCWSKVLLLLFCRSLFDHPKYYLFLGLPGLLPFGMLSHTILMVTILEDMVLLFFLLPCCLTSNSISSSFLNTAISETSKTLSFSCFHYHFCSANQNQSYYCFIN